MIGDPDDPRDCGEWAAPDTLRAGDKIVVNGRVRTVREDCRGEVVVLRPTSLTSVDAVQVEDLDREVEVVRAEGD